MRGFAMKVISFGSELTDKEIFRVYFDPDENFPKLKAAFISDNWSNSRTSPNQMGQRPVVLRVDIAIHRIVIFQLPQKGIKSKEILNKILSE